MGMVIKTVQMSESDFRAFYPKYETFIKEHVGWLGFKYIDVSSQLNLKEGGYDLILTTNRSLNQGSILRMYDLTDGFLAGYLAAKPTNDIIKVQQEL